MYAADIISCIGADIPHGISTDDYTSTVLATIADELGSVYYTWCVKTVGFIGNDSKPYNIISIEPQFVEAFDMGRLIDELLVLCKMGKTGEVEVLDEYGDHYRLELDDSTDGPCVKLYTGRVAYDDPPDVYYYNR